MRTSRRSVLGSIIGFLFGGKVLASVKPPKEPARRIVKEVVETMTIGSETPITFSVSQLPLPIVHQDFTFAFRNMDSGIMRLHERASEVTLRIHDQIGNQLSVKARVKTPNGDGRGEYEVHHTEIEYVELDLLMGVKVRLRHGLEFLVSFKDGTVINQFCENAAKEKSCH